MLDVARELLKRGLHRGADAVGAASTRATRHPRLAAAVTSAAVAAGTTGMFARRLLMPSPASAVSLASATAASVWDAAKGTVLERAREAGEQASLAVIERATEDVVREAAAEGVDLTTAGLGAVEGAALAARLVRTSRGEAMEAARAAAVRAAREAGDGAALRVDRAIREHARPRASSDGVSETA